MHYDGFHSHSFFFLPSLSLSTLPPLYKSFPHVHYILFCFGHTEFKQDHLNMGTELPNGVLWTHEWLHNGRQCHSFIQNPIVKKNSSGCGILLSLPPSTIDWDKPSLAEAQCQPKGAAVKLWLEQLCHAPLRAFHSLVTYVPAHIFFRPFLLWYEQFFLFNFILKL